MASFVAQSLCRGRRPNVLTAKTHHQRARITAALLRDRAAVRVIIAPHGFGKTHAALEYAETVFSWNHTFWIRASSPCFLRDLDDGTLAEECVAVDERARLVIFDDVPDLKGERVAKLSVLIDDLQEAGCEVLMTCVPPHQAFVRSLEHCTVIEATAMMLDEEECEPIRKFRSAKSGTEVAAQRVPVVAWAPPPDNERLFLKAVMHDGSDGGFLPVVASVMVLRSGRLSDLRAFGLDKLVNSETLERYYPHFGFNLREDSFETIPIETGELSRKFKHGTNAFEGLKGFTSVDDIACAWADMLLGVGRATRACDVVHQFCTKSIIAWWMMGNSRNLLRDSCVFTSLKVMEEIRPSDRFMKSAVDRELAVRYLMLGDADRAYSLMKRYAFDPQIDERTRAFALCLTVDKTTSSNSERALLELKNLLFKIADRIEAEGPEASGSALEVGTGWVFLSKTRMYLAMGEVDFLAQHWPEYVSGRTDNDALLVAARLVFEHVRALSAADAEPDCVSADLTSIASYVVAAVEESYERLNCFAALAALAMEDARFSGARMLNRPLTALELIKVRSAEVTLASQRRLYADRLSESMVSATNRLQTNPTSYLDVRYALKGQRIDLLAPPLDVKLFGPLSMRIGESYLPDSLLRRRGSRVLLALLSVNIGHEIPRERLLELMWPGFTADNARKSFYTVWSELRRALVLNDGNCPYLVKRHNGVCFDRRVVTSDAQRMEDVLRELTFGSVDSVDWPDLYRRVENEFCDEFLPTEFQNEEITRMRGEYHDRLVDALVSASMRLNDEGKSRYSAYFSRAALSRDWVREEAYQALMISQELEGQRTAALATYNRCRRALREELGIDPSPKTRRIYERLLNE